MSCVQIPPFFRGKTFDVRAVGLPYHLADTNMPKHWDQTNAGEGVTVAVLDTGIDPDHPEFSEGQILGGKSFVSRRQGKGYYDGNDHATSVAAIIGGQTVGVAPKCKLLIGKVLGDNGSGSNQGVSEGVYWAVENGADIINMSLGGPVDDRATREAIQHAKLQGVIVIIATGNEAANFVGYPAQHGVGVGAVNRGLKLAYFSNRGKAVDIVGYGVDVYSAMPRNRYGQNSGTSFAAPYNAGVAANRQSAEIKFFGEIRTRTDSDLLNLSTFTTDLGPEGKDTSYGLGMIDLDRAFYERLGPAEPPGESTPGSFIARIEAIGTDQVWNGLLTPEKVGDA